MWNNSGIWIKKKKLFFFFHIKSSPLVFCHRNGEWFDFESQAHGSDWFLGQWSTFDYLLLFFFLSFLFSKELKRGLLHCFESIDCVIFFFFWFIVTQYATDDCPLARFANAGCIFILQWSTHAQNTQSNLQHECNTQSIKILNLLIRLKFGYGVRHSCSPCVPSFYGYWMARPFSKSNSVLQYHILYATQSWMFYVAFFLSSFVICPFVHWAPPLATHHTKRQRTFQSNSKYSSTRLSSIRYCFSIIIQIDWSIHIHFLHHSMGYFLPLLLLFLFLSELLTISMSHQSNVECWTIFLEFANFSSFSH